MVGGDPTGVLFEGNSLLQANVYGNVFGIPLVLLNYYLQVLPSIPIIWFASKVHKFFDGCLPELIRGIFANVFTLVISGLAGLLIIGPVTTILANAVAVGIQSFLAISPILAGFIVGTFWSLLVMFGLHWIIIGMALQLIAQNGFDYIMAAGGIGPMIGMFQGLAICWACRKNMKVRDLAIPATISQICGVGEPLMYSILIPIKKLFAINILGGCVGGAIIGALGTKMYMFGGSGLFGIFNYAGGGGMQDVVKYCIGVAAGGLFAIVATLIAYNDDEATKILG
jgi:PTS system beta-glucosides-specific IIC component